MKLIFFAPIFFLLFVMALCSLGHAQAVPASVKKEILAYLKQQQDCKGQYVQFDVYGVKVGPGKSGFIGSCRYGGGILVLYEKTTSGIKQLLEVDVAMNGGFEPSDKANKGYYDMSVWGSSGGKIYGTIYRWNGSRYVKYKGDF